MAAFASFTETRFGRRVARKRSHFSKEPNSLPVGAIGVAKTYNYQILYTLKPQEAAQKLNDLGRAGWRAIHTIQNRNGSWTILMEHESD